MKLQCRNDFQHVVARNGLWINDLHRRIVKFIARLTRQMPFASAEKSAKNG